MAYTDNFPQRPVFMADFANGGRIDSRATFSRASSANVWDGSKHLSSENLIPYSNLSSGFSFARTTLASTNNSAPDGGSDAASILETADTGLHDVSESIGGCVSGTQYSFVFYLKANGRTKAVFKPQLTTVIAEVTFDLTAATSTVSSGSADSHSITAIGSTGWYKCAVTVTATGTGTGYTQFNLLDGSSSESYAGDVTKGMYAWGASVSSTGETVLNETSGQIHREYAPTLVSKANNVGRFDYSTDGQSIAKGILIEGQATNLLNRSEEFDNAYWSKSTGGTSPSINLTITPNAALSPSGELTADLVVPQNTGGNTLYYIAKNYSFTSGDTYTLSVYAKAAGMTEFTLAAGNTGTWAASTRFTLTGDGSTSVSSGSAQIEKCGNGWFRVSVTGNAGATASTNLLLQCVSGGQNSFDGDDYSGLLLYGAQFEEGAASSYLKAEGSTVTRAAESLSMIDESIFEGGEHSVYWEGTVNGSTADPRLMELSDGTSANRIQLFHNDGNKVMLRTTESGATQASIQISELMAGNSKVVATLKASEARLVRNGSTITSSTVDSFYSPPGLRKINIGTNYTQGGQLDGHVKRVAYYNTALTQTQAEALTS